MRGPTAIDRAPALAGLSRALGIDLTAFRPPHVEARLADALASEGAADLEALARMARAEPSLRTRLRRSIAISVTGAGREPGGLISLAAALRRIRLPGPVRAWSAGCSSGAELCDVATMLAAARRPAGRLLGSDLLEENLAVARAGHGERGCACGRAGAVYERRDIVRRGAPDGEWDVVLCRNVAIYLDGPARARLHATLAGALAPGGLLLLGRSERLTEPRAHGLERVAPHLYRRPA
jgi:chemotaxis methyl-accepting protein methylase